MKDFMVIFVLAIILGIGLNAQEKPRIIVDIPTDQKPWNTLDWNNDPQNFQFAIVTDRTGGHRPGVFLDGIKKINLLQPEFVMSVGDLIEGYTRDTSVLNVEWKEFLGFIDHLDVPFFYVPGNHDITNEVMEKVWQELFGVTYYHFVYNDVLFLCLNSEDNYRGAGRGMIGDEQYNYIEKVLSENKDVKWTLVFLHQPLWIQEDTKRWDDVTKLLSDRSHNVFAGHYHRYFKAEQNNGKYIALATTGGGSRLRGPAFGEFDHVVWVTMTEEGPMIANLLLEGIWDEDVVTQDIVELVRNQPFPIFTKPVYIDDLSIEEVATQIKITNDSDHPMNVKLEGLANSSVFYGLDTEKVMVEPNNVEVRNLKIANTENLNLSDIDPIKINAEVSYKYGERPDIVYNKHLYYKPVFKNVTNKTSNPVNIDGNLKEWGDDWMKIDEKNYTGSPFEYKGEKDCSIMFSTAYDDKYLYLAIDITDDEIYSSNRGSYYRQDALQLAIDARPLHISERNVGSRSNVDWLSYLLNFRDEDAVYNPGAHPKGILNAFSFKDGGVQVEVAIPVEYLDEKHNNPWENIRLGLGYFDYDKGGAARTVHYWHPAWSANESIHGSGMFFKQ